MMSTVGCMPVQAIPVSNCNKVIVTGPCILLKATTVAQQVQALRPKKVKSDDEPEVLRCKRRIDFSKLGYNLPKAQPATVARRNERERNRVKLVNLGFETLREHVPSGRKNKKMSKVETLRSAVEYIKQLQEVLQPHVTDSSCSSPQSIPDTMDSAPSPVYPSQVTDSTQLSVPSLGSQFSNPMSDSPSPSSCSDTSYDSLSSLEETDLMDFSHWISELYKSPDVDLGFTGDCETKSPRER